MIVVASLSTELRQIVILACPLVEGDFPWTWILWIEIPWNFPLIVSRWTGQLWNLWIRLLLLKSWTGWTPLILIQIWMGLSHLFRALVLDVEILLLRTILFLWPTELLASLPLLAAGLLCPI